jgi:hypothetical protein
MNGTLFSGFSYNSMYRTRIGDEEALKFLDYFLGPNAIASAMLSAVRNSLSRMAVRVALGLFLPVTRAGGCQFHKPSGWQKVQMLWVHRVRRKRYCSFSTTELHPTLQLSNFYSAYVISFALRQDVLEQKLSVSG